jgi:threonine-phosphate decarboxylase
MDAIAFDRDHGGAGRDRGLIDFSVSINPFGPPPAVLEAYHRAGQSIGVYPEPYAATLTARIAHYLAVAPVNVVAGNGSTQLFYLIARVLRPRRPVVVIPTFSEIANSLLTSCAAPSPLALRRERGYRFEVDEICAAVESGADALFFGRPNSPTGSNLDLAAVRTIAQRCAARGCWCVIDEAFIEFAADPSSAAPMATQFERMIVLRSMTKLYAVPGLRLGYLTAAQEVAGELRRALEPWSVSGPAAAVGVACLAQPESWRDRIRSLLRSERIYVEQELRKIPALDVFPSEANFLMFASRAEPDALIDHLRQHGIVVRNLASRPGAGPGLYRAGVRARPDNDRLVQALADATERAG